MTDASGAEQGNDPITFTVSRNSALQAITVNLVWSLARSANLNGAITVNLTMGGTAAAGRYTLAASGGTLTGNQLTMPEGVASVTIRLTPVADGTPEAAQTAVLTIASGTGYALGNPTSATVTLYDTNAPTITISPANVTVAGSTANQNLTFTVTLSGSSPTAVGVTVKTANGTAIAGVDYTALSKTLTFQAGTITAQTVTVALKGRATGTVNKTFTVALSSPTGGATLGNPSTSNVTITGTSAQVTADVASGSNNVAPLTSSDLQPVVTAAEQAWVAAGIAPARFASVHFVLTSQLPLGEIGYTDGDTIYLDQTAAGFGWYTGSSAGFDANGVALPGSAAAGRLDLLTVVLHELGHTIGLPDGCDCGAYSVLMQALLPVGVQRLLPAGAVSMTPAATIGLVRPESTATISLGAAVPSVRPGSARNVVVSAVTPRQAKVVGSRHRRRH